MFRSFVVGIIFFTILSCGLKKTEASYDKDLVKLEKITTYRVSTSTNMELNGKISKIVNDKVNFSESFDSNDKSGLHLEGKFTVLPFELLLFTNEQKTIAKLFLNKNNEEKAMYGFKAFQLGFNQPESMDSYILDNYILTVKKVDFSFDMISDKDETAKFSFVISKIEQDGTIQILEEERARKVGDSLFVNQVDFTFIK